MGGGGGGGGDGVKIPEKTRKTIQSIREITGKQHSDEDIYSLLQDCSMDPNDTAQKLFYLDTFHEVKRRRDRRKEAPDAQGQEQGQGQARGRLGSFSSKYNNSDVVAGRNTTPRRENGWRNIPQRGNGVNCLKKGVPTTKKLNNNVAFPVEKVSTGAPNGPSTLPNGSSRHGRVLQLPARDFKTTKDGSAVDVIEPKKGKAPSSLINVPNSATLTSLSGVYSSASDPILAPSATQHPSAMNSIKSEVVNKQNSAEQNHAWGNSDDTGSKLPKNDKVESEIVNSLSIKNELGKSTAIEVEKFSEPLEPSSGLENDDSLANKSSGYDIETLEELVTPVKVTSSEGVQTNASSPSLPETIVPNGHVIFPNHFKILESSKIALTFGSFGANAGSGIQHSNGNGGDINSTDSIKSVGGTDDTERELSSAESDSSTVQEDHSVQSGPAQHVLDKVLESGSILVPIADSKGDQGALGDHSKQEIMLLTEASQNHAVQIVPNYGFGIMPTVQGVQQPVQFEGQGTQARDVHLSSDVAENSTPSSSPTPTPPVQNSLAASPHLLYRLPYPPNYLPYGHYLNPYFLPPMHQFLSHNDISQQLSIGNTYLTSAATVPEFKFPLTQLKPGTSGSISYIGVPPLYGSYGSSPIGLNPGPAVTSGGPIGNGDLSASQLKESQIYPTGPLGGVSTRIPSPGQDISSLQLNSLYHILPPGQHLTLSAAQVGHGHFSGIYPPMQTTPASSTVNSLLQQPQAVSAAVDSMRPPSAAYQQPQLAHINWNSSY